ncbi:MAG: hypothetical protein IJM25_03475 [Eubacterium sp.]|nr:hypothetical protein [Eubacterium sp.]
MNGQYGVCPNCGAPFSVGGSPCRECGCLLRPNDSTCPNCGAPSFRSVPGEYAVSMTPEYEQNHPVKENTSDGNTMVICAMVMAFIFPPLGLILGILSLKKAGTKTQRNLAITSIILSIIWAIILTILLVIFLPKIFGLAEKSEKVHDFLDKLGF